ncbi:hypothetical protein MW887_011031 [Aspergillus wentii]|nr:hypothetical protein MW887_011031 [Aspergillus wentii]
MPDTKRTRKTDIGIKQPGMPDIGLQAQSGSLAPREILSPNSSEPTAYRGPQHLHHTINYIGLAVGVLALAVLTAHQLCVAPLTHRLDAVEVLLGSAVVYAFASIVWDALLSWKLAYSDPQTHSRLASAMIPLCMLCVAVGTFLLGCLLWYAERSENQRFNLRLVALEEESAPEPDMAPGS